MYTTYMDNCTVPACFSPLLLALILVSCILFSSFFSGSTVIPELSYSFSLSYSFCIDYFHLWYTHLQLILIDGFQIFFCIIFQGRFVKTYVYLKMYTSIYFQYSESLAINTINCAHLCLYLWNET